MILTSVEEVPNVKLVAIEYLSRLLVLTVRKYCFLHCERVLMDEWRSHRFPIDACRGPSKVSPIRILTLKNLGSGEI